MLLLDPLKVHVLRNEPIKGQTWDRLRLTTESNFTLLNSMRPLNERWLPPLCHPSLSVYDCYVILFHSLSVLYHFLASQPLCGSLHCSLLLSVGLSVSPYRPPGSLPLSVFHLRSGSFSSPTCHSPGAHLCYSAAVAMVFSSIYSEATRLLKAEWLPWALLFAWDFLPLTLFKCN